MGNGSTACLGLAQRSPIGHMSISSKRLREEEQEIADNLLGEELNDLFAANQVSAKKANSLPTKSTKAGLKFRHAFKNKGSPKNDGVMDEKNQLGESFIGVKSFCGKKSSRLRWHRFFVST